MDFGKLFQSVESAVYEVLVWILILPKTLFRAMINPRLTMTYVDEEWKIEKPEERFDEYLSPVLLWLIMVVAPALYLLGDKSILDEKYIKEFTQYSIYSMILPLVYISWAEILNKTSIKRSMLKRAFYKHCYALTSGAIVTALCFVAAFTITSSILGVAQFGFFAFFAVPAYESFVFESELGVNYKKAFRYALVPHLVLIAAYLLLLLRETTR